MNSNLKIFHGEIFLNVVNEYYPESDMKHILLSTPFLWDDLHTLDFPEKKIAWLLAIPISEKEFLFAKENDVNKLETIFENKKIDIFDIERQSVL